ncbi:MAG: RDD family protein [Gemmatimonadetes bacterium]|nr:RDD family protein [Gemmatimonadota bacterium]
MSSEAEEYESYPKLEPDDVADGASEEGEQLDPEGELVDKADLSKRIVAGLIDGVAAMIVGMIPVLGWIVAPAYWLLRDGLDIDFMDRRSIGKKLTKLRPVRDDGLPMDIETSVRRNWVFAIGGLIGLLAAIPIIGWLLLPFAIIAAITIGAVEIFLTVVDPEGRRFGDKFAGTKVIEVED